MMKYLFILAVIFTLSLAPLDSSLDDIVIGKWEHYSYGRKLIVGFGKRHTLIFNEDKTCIFKETTYKNAPDGRNLLPGKEWTFIHEGRWTASQSPNDKRQGRILSCTIYFEKYKSVKKASITLKVAKNAFGNFVGKLWDTDTYMKK